MTVIERQGFAFAIYQEGKYLGSVPEAFARRMRVQQFITMGVQLRYHPNRNLSHGYDCLEVAA